MARSRRLQVEITGDNRDFRRAVDGSERRLSGFGSRIGRFATGATAALAGAFAVRELAQFGTSLFNQGAQLDVFATKVNTVFGDQAESVREWAEANDAAFGLTEQQLAGAAASMGDLLVPMGFSRDEAAGMSTDMLGLAGALSAWSGGTRSAAEVADILSKALLGEREQLKELGVSISEADVQAQMAAMGMEGLTGEALQQGKALATQALLFQRTQDAQEAWSDGSMDAIKTQNELKAVFAELKEELAIRLFPVFLRIASFLTDRVIPAFERLVNIFQEEGIAGLFEELRRGIAQAVPVITAQLWQWLQDVGAWFVNDALPWLGEKAGELASALWTWISGTAWPATLEALERWAGNVGDFLADVVLPNLGSILTGKANYLWDWITERGIPGALNALAGFWQSFLAGITVAIPAVARALARFVPEMIRWVIESIPGLIANLARWASSAAVWIGTVGIPTLGRALAGGIGFMALRGYELFLAVLTGIRNALPAIMQFVVSVPVTIATSVANAFGLAALFNAGVDLMNSLWDGLRNLVPSILEWARGIAGDIADAIIPDSLPDLPGIPGLPGVSLNSVGRAAPRVDVGVRSGRTSATPVTVVVEMDSRVVAKTVENASLERPLRVRLA